MASLIGSPERGRGKGNEGVCFLALALALALVLALALNAAAPPLGCGMEPALVRWMPQVLHLDCTIPYRTLPSPQGMLPRSQKKAWTEIFAPFPVERDAWWVGVWCMVCGG